MVNSSVVGELLCSSAEFESLILAWLTLYLLLLPLFLYVLYVGYTRMKKQAPSHYDVFTYNIVAMEIVAIVGTCFYYTGTKMQALTIGNVGDHLFIFTIFAQIFLHSLTCVERYLAVVHPITYLRLKKRGGVTIRNVSIVVVWLLSVGLSIHENLPGNKNYRHPLHLCITSLALAFVSFCSVSVLCVLVRPGPGKGGRDLWRIDQSKRRAFFIMMAITGVLILRLLMLVPVNLVFSLRLMDFHDGCLFYIAMTLFYLPSSLVPMLMFLHKTGKLPKSST